MKEIAKRYDPKMIIERHNKLVKKLVFNKKVDQINLTYLFAFLNRIFFSDLIVNVTIGWGPQCRTLGG